MPKKLTQEEFIQKAKAKHGDTYDYSESIYITSDKEIDIRCKKHGIFSQRANGHLNGKGCKDCGYERMASNQTLTQEEFLERAIKVHGNLYDYSQSVYITSNKEIDIRCKKHGIFHQTPRMHINGQGCSKCSSNISKPEIEWLDSLNIPHLIRNEKLYLPDGTLIKPDGRDNMDIYEMYGDYIHGNPNNPKYKPTDYNKRCKKTFGELYEDTLKREQKIKDAGYNLITIWESEWKQIKKEQKKKEEEKIKTQSSPPSSCSCCK